jgi:CRISPR-associated protein Cas5t
MKKQVFVVDITSWTASFRYPNLISGFQPTLEVPPLSTILGLINAAAGQYMDYKHLEIGYYFQFQGKAVDLETIYQIEGNKGKATNNAKSNVIRREFLFDNFLRIYTTNKEVAECFQEPIFPLLLGRMNDLATIEKKGVNEIELESIENADKICGQLIPLSGNFLPGVVQALPVYFTDDIPRNNLGTAPFSVINWQSRNISSKITAFRDESLGKNGVDIFFHNLDFSKF